MIKISAFLEEIAKDKKKLVAMLALTFSLAYLDYSFVLVDQFKNLRGLNQKISTVRQNIEKLNKDLAGIKELKLKKQEMGALSSGKAKQIISNDQIPKLLKEISDLANAAGVRIMQMSPVKEVKSSSSTAKKDAPNINAVTINLDLSCDYHRFGQFMAAVENSDVLLAVVEIRINPVANDYFNQSINLRLKTYAKK